MKTDRHSAERQSFIADGFDCETTKICMVAHRELFLIENQDR